MCLFSIICGLPASPPSPVAKSFRVCSRSFVGFPHPMENKRCQTQHIELPVSPATTDKSDLRRPPQAETGRPSVLKRNISDLIRNGNLLCTFIKAHFQFSAARVCSPSFVGFPHQIQVWYFCRQVSVLDHLWASRIV